MKTEFKLNSGKTLKIKDRAPFFEAKRQIESEGGRIISIAESKELPQIFAHSANTPQRFFLFWMDLIVAFPRAGSFFKDSIECTDPGTGMLSSLDTSQMNVLLEGKFRTTPGLAVAFSRFELMEMEKRVEYRPGEVTLIKRFPQENGYFGHDGATGLPIDNGASDSFAWRTKEARIGPVSGILPRKPTMGTDHHYDVFMRYFPSHPLTAIGVFD